MEIMETEYQEALDYLYSQLPMFSRTGAAAYKPGLETSIELARYFGNPYESFKSIHIGGTNGKGSTSHMIASVLQSAGYKTGLYTSPHLVDFRERIRVNGRMIPKKNVVDFVKAWKKSGYAGHPSFFELTMIMAFNYFAEEGVDYAVIEVGMGGRLDSTNIITPELSVITNISHDHNQFLGDTLVQIAREKAGIIKSGIPVVIGETQTETENVFKEKAKEMNSKITFADQVKESLNCEDISLPLYGDYQQKNLATVLCAISELQKRGVEISGDAIKEGIEKVIEQTGLRGRWMIVSEKPVTIADTGHNIGGLQYNFNQLRRLKKEKGDNAKLRIIIGFVADKAIDKILDILPREAEYYVTNADIPRALPADKLLEKFRERGFESRKFNNVKEAVEAAKREASEDDIIYIGGSTFIVADFLR